MKSKSALLIFFALILFGASVYLNSNKIYSLYSKYILKDSSEVALPIFETGDTSKPVANDKQLNLSDSNCNSVTQLAENLDLFDLSGMYAPNDPNLPVSKYYCAGMIPDGTYKGYKRIVGIHDSIGPGGPSSYVFATKDGKNFIVNGNPADEFKYKVEDYRHPFYLINTKKVTSVDKIDFTHPDTIKLSDNFLLFRRGPEVDSVTTGDKSPEGYDVYTPILVTDFSKYHKLSVTPEGLSLLAISSTPNQQENLSAEDKEIQDISNKYEAGTTFVVAVDKYGLGESYILTTPKNYSVYLDKLQKEDYVSYPNLKLTSTEITLSKDVNSGSLYKEYSVAFPGACGMDYDSPVIKNVSDSDFSPLGSLAGLNLFKLKDINHPMYKLSYTAKVDYSDEMFGYANPDTKKPTLTEYAKKNPLIFFKDFWGRWVALGEYDYILSGGCGKPVVYLYPTEETKVNIKFEKEINFQTQIPFYSLEKGWNVLASPDGVLTDLQPEFTNCSEIDFTHAGSEYAKNSCETHRYPYLYWSGNVLGSNYIKPTEGWVVSKSDLSSFINNKLTYMGLNSKEILDFTSYWMPKMLNENKEYYRISFLQTREMNDLAPMSVTPKPDTTFRIFLDYVGLDTKPKTDLVPQNLAKLVRKGFTLVEWGGLNY